MMECAFPATFLPLSNTIRQYDYNLSPLIIKQKMERILVNSWINPLCPMWPKIRLHKKILALYTDVAIYYGVLKIFEFKFWEKIVIEVKKWQILTTFAISFF